MPHYRASAVPRPYRAEEKTRELLQMQRLLFIMETNLGKGVCHATFSNPDSFVYLALRRVQRHRKTVPSAEYTVQDVRGKVVSLVKAPQKVLTDSLHLDETLLCIVPADHLAGAYYLDEEPGISFIAAETKTVQPKLRQVTPETVASLHPDVFLASQWSDPGLIQKVEEMGIPVVVCYGPVTLQQIQENVKLIGKTMGKEKKAMQSYNKCSRSWKNRPCSKAAIILEACGPFGFPDEPLWGQGLFV